MMNDRELRFRTAAITYFPMFIAALSLFASVYNNYLNSRIVDIYQQALGRGEDLRTCRDIIDAYFQVKFVTRLVSESGAKAGGTAESGPSAVQINAANAVSKFAALGTYLANLRGETSREQYTHLTWELEKIVRDADKTIPTALDKLFERADRMFSDMNDDCVKTAKQ